MKLASSEAASPPELVITIPYLPGFSAGITIFSAFISTSVTAADLPPMLAVTPALKPLPRMVKVRAAGRRTAHRSDCSDSHRDPRELDDCQTGRSQRENSLAIFVDSKKSSVQAVQAVHVGASIAKGSSKITRSRKRPVCASRMSTPPCNPVNGPGAGAGPVRNGTYTGVCFLSCECSRPVQAAPASLRCPWSMRSTRLWPGGSPSSCTSISEVTCQLK